MPKQFKDLFFALKKAINRGVEADDKELNYCYQNKFSKLYDEIIETAYIEPPIPESTSTKKKGRKKW